MTICKGGGMSAAGLSGITQRWSASRDGTVPVSPVCKEPKNACTPSATLPRNATWMVVTTASIRAALRRRTTSVQRRRSRSPSSLARVMEPQAQASCGHAQIGQICTRRGLSCHSPLGAQIGYACGLPGHSTTYRDRYPPDGPTPRASAIRCLAARAFPPHGAMPLSQS